MSADKEKLDESIYVCKDDSDDYVHEDWRDPWKDAKPDHGHDRKTYLNGTELKDRDYGLIEEKDTRRLNIKAYIAALLLLVGFGASSIFFRTRNSDHTELSEIVDKVLFLGSLDADQEEDTGDGDDGLCTEETAAVPETEHMTEAEIETETETEPETISIEEQVTIETYQTSRDMVLIVTNNSDSYLYGTFQAVYYDADGKMMDMEHAYVSDWAPGQRRAGYILAPRDRSGKYIPYDHYEIMPEIEVREKREGYKYYGDQFTIEANVGVDGTVLADIGNPTGLAFDCMTLACIFYNGDEVVGIANKVSPSFEEKVLIEFFPPYDEEYQPVPFDRFEIIINTTESYY